MHTPAGVLNHFCLLYNLSLPTDHHCTRTLPENTATACKRKSTPACCHLYIPALYLKDIFGQTGSILSSPPVPLWFGQDHVAVQRKRKAHIMPASIPAADFLLTRLPPTTHLAKAACPAARIATYSKRKACHYTTHISPRQKSLAAATHLFLLSGLHPLLTSLISTLPAFHTLLSPLSLISSPHLLHTHFESGAAAIGWMVSCFDLKQNAIKENC